MTVNKEVRLERDLDKVLDEIVEVAPDLAVYFVPIRRAIPFTAPEVMFIRWREVAVVLTNNASDHVQRKRIAEIFSGTGEHDEN